MGERMAGRLVGALVAGWENRWNPREVARGLRAGWRTRGLLAAPRDLGLCEAGPHACRIGDLRHVWSELEARDVALCAEHEAAYLWSNANRANRRAARHRGIK